MSDGVRTIFKSIGLTIVLIIVSSLVIEMYNVELYSAQMKRILNISITKSCDYFGQETYKREAMAEGKGNVTSILGNNGAVAVDGTFYNNLDNAQGIYNDLYGSADFDVFANSTLDGIGRKPRDIWSDLNYMYCGLKNVPMGNAGDDEIADYYNESLMTALNCGVVYLDKDTVQRIMKWNAVMIFSNGQQSMVVTDVDGGSEPYVKYKGFRIYYNTLNVDSITYKGFDLFNVNDRAELSRLTNISYSTKADPSDPSKDVIISSNYNSNTNTTDEESTGISEDDERRYVCVAEINYSVDIGYEGVTPLKQILKYVAETRVDGFNGSSTSPDTYVDASQLREQATGGGNGSAATFGTSKDKIIYYIVR